MALPWISPRFFARHPETRSVLTALNLDRPYFQTLHSRRGWAYGSRCLACQFRSISRERNDGLSPSVSLVLISHRFGGFAQRKDPIDNQSHFSRSHQLSYDLEIIGVDLSRISMSVSGVTNAGANPSL